MRETFEAAGAKVSEGMWMITHPYILGLWLLACVLSAWKGWTAQSLFCGFIFAFFASSRLWGVLALRKVSLEVASPRTGLFPGQRLSISRVVKNDKLLPLLWMELLEPYDPKGCLKADKRYLAYREDLGENNYYCLYSLAYVNSRQTVRFADKWLAVHRGVRRVDSVELRSGDGFGICPKSLRYPLEKACLVAVYPALVSVDVEAALRDIWDSFSSSAGSLEDALWIKSIRDYMPQDPAKRINQRLLARGQGLKVNQYEVVAPDEALFIVDAASFMGASAAFEESLSVLASLITGLQARGFKAGLLAPKSDYFPQTYVQPSSQTYDLARMLELLASVQVDNPPLGKMDALSFANSHGQVYYLTHSVDDASSLDVLDQFPEHKCQILAYMGETASRWPKGWRIRSVASLRKC
jgi:uncharacterized protein (DUF58 family)